MLGLRERKETQDKEVAESVNPIFFLVHETLMRMDELGGGCLREIKDPLW